MRSRYRSPSDVMYSFGPGPLTPAVKAIVIANVAVFVVTYLLPAFQVPLWLNPQNVVHGEAWRLVTYMFVHAGFFHLLFNMLAIWMFGVELERMWGSRYFATYYFVCGIAAALTTVLLSFVPLLGLDQLYFSSTVGASGAALGILLAYALYFPNRPIYMYLVFPIPAKYFVMIIGAISLLSAAGGPGGGVAHVTHLGGLAGGYLFLKRGRFHPIAELKYQYLRWRSHRLRRRFDVHTGGRIH